MKRDVWGLNLLNFFLSEIAAIIVPFLKIYLRDHEWHYDEIGLAVSVAGLGSLIMQIPVGILCDRLGSPRLVLAMAAIALGATYAILPTVVDNHPLTFIALFFSGIFGTFFAPLLNTLALILAGKKELPELLGLNRSWSHIGNAVAAITSFVIIHYYGLRPLFYLAMTFALLGALSLLMIQGRTLTSIAPSGPPTLKVLRQVAGQKIIAIFLLCTALYHLVTAPLGSFMGLYVKAVGGTDSQVAIMSLIVMGVMIPTSWLAGRASAKVGIRFMMLFPLAMLPLRAALYLFTNDPYSVLAVTALDGIISGAFGVAVVVFSSHLVEKTGGFNSVMGVIYTLPAIGAVVGTAVQGFLIENFGFKPSFAVLAVIAAVGAVVFYLFLPRLQEEKVKT